ncbi:WD40 repeat-like protein [Hygrophoropsis aurantiaca]|uniref:WD40 repeat-like protein n=1 Tax=Hygrophoropsis aurantiaca TaxID=72124 RepID=A0ACB8A4U2_9AGAM|nr:WD40 repeat-like protein [Hygrophoropsis aurantiaca]
MPDPFFAQSKKRKRPTGDAGNTRARESGIRKNTSHHSFNSNPRAKAALNSQSKGKSKQKRDEELDSDHTDDEVGAGGIDDLELRADPIDPGLSGDEDEEETPAQKRLRLAQIYLEGVREGIARADGEFDAAEIDKELISARLQQDVLEHSGRIYLFVADQYDFSTSTSTVPSASSYSPNSSHHPTLRTRGHRLSTTAAVASPDARWLFSAGKEGSIIKWDLHTGRRIETFHKHRSDTSDAPRQGKFKGKAKFNHGGDIQGHTDSVLALAMSPDGRYLASGGQDRRVGVWEVERGSWVGGFGGHRGWVASLAFRKSLQQCQLFTASHDRTIKLFDLSSAPLPSSTNSTHNTDPTTDAPPTSTMISGPTATLAYIETLFGHQDSITCIDALRGETAVSAGARDRTVRFWKVADESQLVFRGGGGGGKVREILEGGLGGGEDENMPADDDTERRRGGKEAENGKRYVEGSIECVAMIDEVTFVSGGDSGSISLWTTQKKKPVFTQTLCHGFHEVASSTAPGGAVSTPRWVTAVACLRYSDLFVSGSWEGCIRIWKLDAKLRSFAPIGTIPVPGVVNSLQIVSLPKHALDEATWATAILPQDPLEPTNASTVAQNSSEILPIKKQSQLHKSTNMQHKNGTDAIHSKNTPSVPAPSLLVVAALGQEHRLGRWLSVKGEGVVNGTRVIKIDARAR